MKTLRITFYITLFLNFTVFGCNIFGQSFQEIVTNKPSSFLRTKINDSNQPISKKEAISIDRILSVANYNINFEKYLQEEDNPIAERFNTGSERTTRQIDNLSRFFFISPVGGIHNEFRLGN